MYDRRCMNFANIENQFPFSTRLKVDHIVTETQIGEKRDGTPIMEKKINWDFWQDLSDRGIRFDIYIDEAHNVLHSRRSNTKFAVLMTTWLAQIRKILGESEQNHLYLITQRFNAVDVTARELAQEIIMCQKMESLPYLNTKVISPVTKEHVYKPLPVITIIKRVFMGTFAIEKYISWMMGKGKPDRQASFIANPFFRFYNSYAFVRFGESVYL